MEVALQTRQSGPPSSPFTSTKYEVHTYLSPSFADLDLLRRTSGIFEILEAVMHLLKHVCLAYCSTSRYSILTWGEVSMKYGTLQYAQVCLLCVQMVLNHRDWLVPWGRVAGVGLGRSAVDRLWANSMRWLIINHQSSCHNHDLSMTRWSTLSRMRRQNKGRKGSLVCLASVILSGLKACFPRIIMRIRASHSNLMRS